MREVRTVVSLGGKGVKIKVMLIGNSWGGGGGRSGKAGRELIVFYYFTWALVTQVYSLCQILLSHTLDVCTFLFYVILHHAKEKV